MNKKQILFFTLLSIHNCILFCTFINIIICLLKRRFDIFPISYNFFNVPLYRYIQDHNVHDLLFLIFLIIFSVFLTFMECKEIINSKKILFSLSNGLWIATYGGFSSLTIIGEFEQYGEKNIIAGLSLIIGLSALIFIALDRTYTLVRHKTNLESVEDKYLPLNKLTIVYIHIYFFMLGFKYFFSYTESFDETITFIVFVFHFIIVYLGTGNILFVNKKLKRTPTCNAEALTLSLKKDRSKMLILSFVSFITFFVFYL
ncbi:MAG: hypothetical protein UH241_08175 [Acutalibacteraceae bacterium]|nr:hypothetical protein [Acutalibacteraceae bacterium]